MYACIRVYICIDVHMYIMSMKKQDLYTCLRVYMYMHVRMHICALGSSSSPIERRKWSNLQSLQQEVSAPVLVQLKIALCGLASQ